MTIVNELLCGDSPLGAGFAFTVFWCLLSLIFGFVICGANVWCSGVVLSQALDVLVLGLLR